MARTRLTVQVYFKNQLDSVVTVSGGTFTGGSNGKALGYITSVAEGSVAMVGTAAPGSEWDETTALTTYKYVNVTLQNNSLYYNLTDGTLHIGSMSGAEYSDKNIAWSGSGDTLILSGLNFTTSAPTALYLPNEATIELAQGKNNTVTSTYSGTDSSTGIDVDGALTIRGGGTLTATGGTTTGSSGVSYRVFASGNISISGGTVSGGTAGTYSYGT